MSFNVSADAYLRFMGRYSEPLAARFAEPSASFAAAVRERLPGVDVRQCPAERLPFPDDGPAEPSPPASGTTRAGAGR